MSKGKDLINSIKYGLYRMLTKIREAEGKKPAHPTSEKEQAGRQDKTMQNRGSWSPLSSHAFRFFTARLS